MPEEPGQMSTRPSLTKTTSQFQHSSMSDRLEVMRSSAYIPNRIKGNPLSDGDKNHRDPLLFLVYTVQHLIKINY